MKERLSALLEGCGLIAITAGTSMVSIPAGLIVGGGLAVAYSVLLGMSDR